MTKMMMDYFFLTHNFRKHPLPRRQLTAIIKSILFYLPTSRVTYSKFVNISTHVAAEKLQCECILC